MADFDPNDVLDTPQKQARRPVSDFDPADVVASGEPGEVAGNTTPSTQLSQGTSNDFDPADVVHTATSDFDPKDVVGTPTPTSDPEYDKVKDTLDRSFWKANTIGTEPTTDKELEAIAKHHGVDPDALKSIATNLGAHREGPDSSVLGELESSLGRGVGLGIPQFIAKKSVDEGPMRDAIDDVRELASQKRSFAQGLAENLVPVGAAARGLGLVADTVGAGAKEGLKKALVKGAAEGAATGATFGVAGSREGHEVEGAESGAVIGGALGTAATSIGRIISHLSSSERAAVRAMPEAQRAELEEGTKGILSKRQQSEEIIRDHVFGDNSEPLTFEQAKVVVDEQVPHIEHDLDPSTEEGHMHTQANGGDNANTVIARAQDVIEQRALDLAEHVTKDRPESLEEAQKALRDSGQGLEKAHESFNILAVRRAAEEYLDHTGLRLGSEETAGGRLANAISDQFPMRVIDEKLKAPISAEITLNELNKNINRMRWVQEAHVGDLEKLAKDNPTALEALKDGTITDAIDRGTVGSLSPELQPVAHQVSEVLEKWRDFANDKVRESDPHILPLNIQKLENYVPHLLLSPEKAIRTIQGKVAEALEQAGVAKLSDIPKPEFQALLKAEGPIQDLEKALKLFDAKGSKTAADLESRLQQTFQGREAPQRLATAARATEQRTGDIPDFLKEKNAFILMSRWSQNTLRHLYLRSPLEKLSTLSKIAEKSGAILEKNYLNRHLADLNGVRPGTVSAYTRGLGYKWQSSLSNVIHSPKTPDAMKAAAEVGRALPYIFQDMTAQIYPNLIGVNLKSHLQHLIQPFYKMWPELGGSYGGTVVARAMVKTLMHLPTAIEAAAKDGYYPAEFVPKFQYLTAEGLRANKVYSGAMQAANKFGSASMFFYTKIFEMNKAIAQSAGEMLAHDLASGHAGAARTMKRLPSAIQRAVAVEPQNAAQILGHYLADSTVYNYNRASMSEFGRAMGPMFSTFSKWPLSTVGDILAEYRTKPAGQASLAATRKYLAPLVAMKGMQYLIFGDPEDMSDRQKKILGASGLGGMAPLMSVMELKHRDMSTPPAVEMIYKGLVLPAVHGLQEGDSKAVREGLVNGFSNMVQLFGPGSVWVRFLTDDLPTYLSGHRPQGDTFLDRSVEGARKMTR